MNKILLISLISDQAIPNIQMIKEVRSKYENCDYLMITTNVMEKKGVSDNILKACNIIENVRKIEVSCDSYVDIKKLISDLNYSDYEKIIVNITGGTKMMMLAAFDFFKEMSNTEIYYIPGNSLKYSQLYPENSKPTFAQKIKLKEYLTGYGFKITETESSGITIEQTKIIFDSYCKGEFDKHKDAQTILRAKRGKGILKIDDSNELSEFLSDIKYTPVEKGKLNQLEIKYLSGEWFEEYIGYKVKTDLELSDNEILVGAKIFAESKGKNINSLKELIDDDSEADNNKVENEIDVMFVYNNSLYVIECKTSIINIKEEPKEKKDKKGNIQKDENGNIIYYPKKKKDNILGETIFKSDALKTKFGLYAKSYIFTLTDFIQYIDEANDKINIKKQMIITINRANVSNIKLIDKRQILNANSIKDLL